MHEGHRQRMVDRLIRKEKMQAHELLEMLLYLCLPRVNTNEIAHRLLDAFGNIPAVFKADYNKLRTVDGVGKKTAEKIFLFGQILECIASFEEDNLPYAYTYESFSNYLGVRFQKATQEYVEIYAVRGEGELSFCKRFTSDEINRVKIPAHEIAEFIANFKPRKVILVHNHPKGECTPSEDDDEFTRKICLYFDLCGVEVYDHCIVSPLGVFSYRIHNLMDEIRNTYTAQNAMEKLK